ncbi:MAG: IS200/IS605 family transposase [bacterium]|nr:IS200/IS605 family transposase [bacterium]
MDSETLAHTKWNCKYHIVFAPKFRRQIVYGKMKQEIGKILRSLCERKEIEIVEAELCPDHIHMLISVPPKYSISQVMGYLKGKSSLMIFDKFAQMKYKYGNRRFWCRGYYVDTVGRNQKKIAEYIRKQLQEDYQADQLSLFETTDPFTGNPVSAGNKVPRKPL